MSKKFQKPSFLTIESMKSVRLFVRTRLLDPSKIFGSHQVPWVEDQQVEMAHGKTGRLVVVVVVMFFLTMNKLLLSLGPF